MSAPQSTEGIFRVNVRVKKHKTQGQMLADFSEAVIAKREDGIRANRKPWENDPAALAADQTSPMVSE